MKQKLHSQNGVSIILALVLMLVCSLGCISLYTITSSAIQHATLEKDHEQAMILAASVADLVKDQIENNPPDGTNAPASGTISNYLYENIGYGWNYYMPDSVFNSNLKVLTREFDLSPSISIDADVTLSMYWESTSEAESSGVYDNDARSLYITIEVVCGKEHGAITQVYYYRKMADNSYWWTYGESL